MLWSHSCKNQKIFISKKITSVGWSSRCKFFWNALDPTLVIFLTFFEKNYNNWIKCKLPKFQIKWTGLQWNLDFWFAKKDFTPLCFQKKLNWMPLHLDRGGCCGAKYIWWKIMSLNPDLVSTVAIIFAHPRTNQDYLRFLGWA